MGCKINLISKKQIYLLKESIKIERIYIDKYTDLELFNKKDYF